MTKNLNYLILALFALVSCSTSPEQKFKNLLAEGRCEEAAYNIPGYKVKPYAGTPRNYALTRKAHGVIVAHFVSNGITEPKVACSPMPILSVPSKTVVNFDAANTNTSKKCFSNDKKTNLPICPNFAMAMNPIMKVTNCLMNSGKDKKALVQLMILLSPNSLGGCINEKQKKIIRQKIETLNSK